MPEGQVADRVERFDATTEDSGEIDHLTRLMFGASVRVERSDGRTPSLRLAQAATAGFGVQRVTWNVDGRCDVAPLDRFLCIRRHRGAYGLDQRDGQVMYAAGDTFLVDPTRPVDADVIGADLDSFTIERSTLDDVAAQIAPWWRRPLDYRHATPVTAPLARAWDAVLDEVNRSLNEHDLVAENSLVRAGLIYRLAATACATFGLVQDGIQERPGSERTVRRATAYIDDHLAEPITVGDIALAAGLSARGLNAAFQRVLGTSPSVYLRRARLAAARRDLLHAPHDTSVADVAQRWGFTHLGRFAANYRTEFDELPSATLRH